MYHHTGVLNGRFCSKYLEEEGGRPPSPFSPQPVTTYATGTIVEAPKEFTFQLTLRDCGATDHSCLTLCVSNALIGDHKLATPLRYLAAAQLLCLPVTIQDESVRELALREVDAAIALGHGLGQPVISALAVALGIKIYYTILTKGVPIQWQCEEPFQAISGAEEQVTAAPTDVPPRNAAFILHNGVYHYLLALPPKAQPLWAETPYASLDTAHAHICEMTEALLTKSKHSDLACLREAAAKIGAVWEQHQQKQLRLHPGRPIHPPAPSVSSTLTAPSPTASTPESSPSGVGEKDAAKNRRPATAPPPAKERRSSESCAFETLLRNDRQMNLGIVDDSDEARAIFAYTQKWRCRKCPGGRLFTAKKDRLINHYQSMHKVDPKQQTLEAFTSVGSNEDRDNLAMCLVSYGLSLHMVHKVEGLRPLFQTSSRLPCTSTLARANGTMDKSVSKVEAEMKRMLSDIPVTLTIDSSSTKFAERQHVVVVCADSAHLDHSLLLDAHVHREAQDSSYYAQRLLHVMKMYAIDPINVVGVATDNTATMPKAVWMAKLPHIPCISHVCNLMVGAIGKQFNLTHVLGFRVYLGNSHERVSRLQERGLHPNELCIPEHRFGYLINALDELCPSQHASSDWSKWESYESVVRANPPKKQRAERDAHHEEDAGNYRQLLERLGSVETRCAALIARALIVDAQEIIRKSEADARRLDESLFPAFFGWCKLLADINKNAAGWVSRQLKAYGCSISPEAEVALTLAVRKAIGTAEKKVASHMQDKSWLSEFKLLKPFRTRQAWQCKDMSKFRIDSGDSDQWADLFGIDVTGSLHMEVLDFNDEVSKWKITQKLPTEHRENAVRFWKAMYHAGNFPYLAAAAMRGLSLLVSNAQAERCFSVLKNRDVPNRRRGEARYARNILMLNANRAVVEKIAFGTRASGVRVEPSSLLEDASDEDSIVSDGTSDEDSTDPPAMCEIDIDSCSSCEDSD